MRLVSYNIYNGGEGRADPIAEVILAQQPDVVALVEADDPTTLQRIANRLSMDFIHAPAKEHGVALLSRWPIVETINHAAANASLHRPLLEAVVQNPRGEQFPIGVLHLPPGALNSDEDSRLSQLKIILDIFKIHRQFNRPHILCGDFNSNAPYQRIDPANCKEKTQQAWKANGSDLPRRVVQTLLDAGYADTFSLFHNEQDDVSGTFTTQHPGQRVDYIFTFGIPSQNVTKAWIEQDRLAKYASDHFPICAEMII